MDGSAFDDPDEAKSYLNSLSVHESRPGDTSALHPDFAINMANAIKQARALGLPVTLQSGFRTPQTTESAYDMEGLSLHDKGAAMDVGGIGGPNSPQAQLWAKIASKNGIYNPYGIGNSAEFNHWQMVPWTLESRPDVQQKIIAAGGNANGVWNAVAPVKAKKLADPFADFGVKDDGAQAAQPNSVAPPITAKTVSDPFEDFGVKDDAAAPVQVAAAPPSVTPPMPNAQIGQGGLIWDANGGHDPKTGELVVAGKPFSPDVVHPQALAGATGVLSGVPIAGPYLQSGVEKAAAAVNALRSGTPYADNLSAIHGNVASSQAANPGTTTAGNVLGGVVGALPAMAAAPAAFGLGEGPLAVRALTSAATSAGIGAADSGARNGLDPQAALRGAEFGGAFGLMGPLAGQAIGSGVSGISNLLARTNPAARNVANALADIGMSPADAQNALTRMGPTAVLADIDPALTTEAGGLAQTGGKATSVLRNAMVQRGAGADDRVSQAVTSALGPRPDITAVKEGIVEQAQKAASPLYQAAAASAQPMDVTPVLSNIDTQLKSLPKGGGEMAVLNKVRGFITQDVVAGPNGEMMTVPKDDPQSLLKARQEVDGMIEGLQRNGSIDGTTAGKNAYRAAVNARGQIDSVLKTDPNIAAGDAVFAHQMANKNALDEGADLLKPATRVEDVARSVASKTPEQVTAMRQGALATIHDAMDNARQGDLSAARSLFAKSTANRAKLDALFPNSGEMFDKLDSEIAQRNTENVVRSGSQTAANQAVRAKYSPASASGGPADTAATIAGEAAFGGPGAAAAYTGSRIFNALRQEYANATLSRLREGTARGLSAVGPAQADFLGQVGRAYRTNGAANALSGGANDATNLLLRSMAPQAQNALAGH